MSDAVNRVLTNEALGITVYPVVRTTVLRKFHFSGRDRRYPARDCTLRHRVPTSEWIRTYGVGEVDYSR